MRKENKLDKNNIESFISLTSLQQGMLFHYVHDEISTEYHEQLSLTIIGDLKVALFQKTLNFVIQNNEMLRTIFRWKGIDKPIQVVLKNHEVPIKNIDLTNELNKPEYLENIKFKDLNDRIDITKETLRVYLCKLQDYKYELIISNHHILYDGWSTGIIVKELIETYSCLYENRMLKHNNKTKYSEFIKYVNSLDKNKQKKYWMKYLEDFNDVDVCLSYNKDSNYKEMEYNINDNKAEQIKNFSRIKKIPLAAILYGVVGVLNQKLKNSNDIIFGTTVSGRNENIKSIDNMVGLFINTVPLRVKTEDHTTLIGLIEKLARDLNERKEVENTSLIDIKDFCKLNKNGDIFDSIVTIENYPLDFNLNKNNVLKIEKFSITEKTNYSMAIEILTFEGLQFKINLNHEVVEENIAKMFGKYLDKIIDLLLINPNIRISEIDLLSEKEKSKILYKFNDTSCTYKEHKLIGELFEEQVEKTPNNVAVVFEDKKLTYKELNEKANKVATHLRSKGVSGDSIVGIMVERSVEMIIGILGILKAGGAYLPLDSNCPKERIEYMLKDSCSKVLLSSKNLVNNIDFYGEVIDLCNEQLYIGSSSNPRIVNNSRSLAYVIYTSGTTGKPKGVMIEQRSVNNLVGALRKNIYSLYDNNLRVALVAPYYFDASVQQIFGAILSGHSLYIVPEDVRKNGQELVKYYEENRIDISDGTPIHLSMISSFIDKKNKLKLRHFIIGGDVLNIDNVKNIYRCLKEVKITNVYGPTECCVDSTSYLIERENINNLKFIPIGTPLENYKLYVLDKNYKCVPIGVPGELCISGHGLARGYLNNNGLNKEKFIDSPFEIEAKMYKTGDLVRYMPDGNIEFLGRIDDQVKIRGFRIELGDIEAKILQHENVKECVVVVKENKEKYLCAYVVCEKEIEELDIKAYLKEHLPDYMIPSYFIQLEKMPLTSNGKLDKRALPEPLIDIDLSRYEAPRNELEENLVQIWSEVLEVSSIGINDNFFELGGHSLKATMLISKIHKKLNREVPIRELFKAPTIKELAKFIKNQEDNPYSKIEKIDLRDYYETSSAQKRMYMIQGLEKDSKAYNMPAVFEIKGVINKERVEETFKKLVVRHEILRTCFKVIEGEIVQKIYEDYEFKLVDRRIDKELKRENIDEFIKPFILEKVPLFRVELLENEEKKYLLIDMHHIISDGVSMGILIKEFKELYSGKILEPLKFQYKDFAEWQNKFLVCEEIKKQEKYWVDRFSDEIPVINLPYDYERQSIQSFEGDNINFELNETTTEKLRKISRETGTTMHMVLLSAFNILLAKYSGQEDIIVGVPIAGRLHADIQNIIGLFVNTLPLRNKPHGHKKYIEFLKEVRETSLEAYENQSYQFENLIEKLEIRRDYSRNPLFDVMFNMQDTIWDKEIQLDDILLTQYDNVNKISKFDITLNALYINDKLEFTIDYSTKLFNRDTIERFKNHFIKILDVITSDTEIKIYEIELVTEKEKNQILYDFNNTKANYPEDKTICELFEEQVEKTPHNIAVLFEGEKITYRELNEKVNSLARVLRNKGVKRDYIVGIMVERSLEMIIGILGILKAGGAYLPIDPNYPKERKEYILNDSESKILLTSNKLLDHIEFDGEIIDLLHEELYKSEVTNLEKINDSTSLAYVIYTSGTTGNPKGVMIEHKSLVNRLNWMQKNYTLTEKDTILQKTTYTFDVSVWELLWWSLVGAKVCMLKGNDEKDPAKIIDAIKKYEVTTIHFVPSMLDVFLYYLDESKKTSSLDSLRQVFCSGEPLNFKQVCKFQKMFGAEKKIINLYGPTEATIDVSYFNCDNNKRNLVPIGKPIDNTKLYILNNKELVPIGVAGELCIGGVGLARGYLNKAELTAEKFIESPFEVGTRIYKTGDLVRWLPDGNIEFLGRIDNQVKIRGFRIELGEIEGRLLEHEEVKETSVIVLENSEGEKYICAYVVSEKDLQELNLKRCLKETLPEYMIPTYFVKIDKMPLTKNDKLDKKALPKPNFEAPLNEYESPRNEVEEKLVSIWNEVLGVTKVGINDNFFEIGGHSLKATFVTSKIQKELGREISIKDLFKAQTIKELSNLINVDEKKNQHIMMKPVEKREYYEISSAQRRMYMLQKFDKDNIAYNIPAVFELNGDFNKEKIEETFNKLCKRHDALRTYFTVLENDIVQKIDETYEFSLIERREEKKLDEIIRGFVRPFDLEKAPLFRVELLENKHRNYLLIDVHHIIADGVSMSILIKEFKELYNGKELESLKFQYKDFAIWQNDFLKSKEMNRQEEYWIKNFSEEIPILNLPYDYKRPKLQSFKGNSIRFEIDKEITGNLRVLNKEMGTTMHMVMLSTFIILLSKYSGQKDIVVGVPIAGRQHPDFENIIGIFINTLALRSKPEGDKKYLNFLEEIKEKCLEAYENQNYQIETLVEKLAIKREGDRNPLFNVIFNSLNNETMNSEFELNGFSMKQYNIESKTSKFDLTLIMIERFNKIEFEVDYCTELFNEDTVEIMIQDYINILETIIEDKEINIKDIALKHIEEFDDNSDLSMLDDDFCF